MAGLFQLILLSFSYSAAYPVVDTRSEDREISLSTSEDELSKWKFSVFDVFQLVMVFGFCLILLLSISIGLRQTIYRLYFRKKKSFEDIDCSNSKYKPVVCIHGLLDSASTLDFFAETIRKNHAGTLVIALDVYNLLNSLKPMWKQIETIKEMVERICAEHPEGINLIGVSQGALLARAVLETSDKHNVDTFISIAGPQMGQFGIPLMHWLPGYTHVVRNIFRCAYTSCCQKLSVFEYWKDPYHLPLYGEINNFLPILNNEKKHPDSQRFKSNFSRLQHLVLIGGPDDGFISPWQSSHFGYYDDRGNIIEMKDQSVYINDSFGLRSLDEKNAVTVYAIPNTAHYFYVFDVPLIKEYMLPHLN